MPDWIQYVRRRLPTLPCRPEREAEIVEELAAQLGEVYRRARSAGASAEEALDEVAHEIPDWTALAAALAAADQPAAARVPRSVALRAEPYVLRSRLGSAAAGLLRELHYAARTLTRNRLFAAVAVLTFALGIGATTAVFSLVDGVLLSPLPFRDPDRLAVVQETIPELARQYPVLGANARSILAWKDACRSSCAGLAAFAPSQSALTGAGEPQMLQGARVSPELFDVLGIRPAYGRAFRPEEASAGRDRVAVLTHGLWQARFGGDPGVVGRSVTLEGDAFEVVGILPASLKFPRMGSLAAAPGPTGEPRFFVPLTFTDDERLSAGEYDYAVILRLAAGATPESAEAELRPITEAEFRSEPVHPQPLVRPLAATIVGRSARSLWLLLGAVSTALLVACVNLAQLLSARWQARQGELAIRTAVGAGTAHLVRQVLAETALLAVAGATLGVVSAAIGLRAFLATVPADVPRLSEVAVNLRVLVFAVATTFATTLLCALVPGLRASHTNPGEMLKAGAHTATDSERRSRARASLLAFESALTTGLLVVGGLLLASYLRVLYVERGFEVDRLLAFDVSLPATRYPTGQDRARFYDRLLDSLRASPGVESAALATRLPLEGESNVDSLIPFGDTRPLGAQQLANHLQVSPAYFETLGIALVRGRPLTDADRGRRVALVSERTARAIWPGQDPIGLRFSRSERSQTWEVVGVVKDARIHGLERDAKLVAYVPYWGGARREVSIVVRARTEAQAAAGTVRAAVALLDAELPLQNLRSMQSVVNGTLAGRRFQMVLTAAFAAAGLLLAAVGIYGVVATSVERRRPELAVRLALGASSREIVGLIMSQSLRPVAVGLASGLLGAVAIGFPLRALLFGVTPYDPLVLAGSGILVAGVSALACLVPAARASRTAPVLVLRGL